MTNRLNSLFQAFIAVLSCLSAEKTVHISVFTGTHPESLPLEKELLLMDLFAVSYVVDLA